MCTSQLDERARGYARIELSMLDPSAAGINRLGASLPLVKNR
jgi:hypothetical protein